MNFQYERISPARLERDPVRRIFLYALVAVVLVFALLFATRAGAQAPDRPVLLVATPALSGFYRGAVMLVAPYKGGHVGLILNRPTPVTMAELFPDHEPSKAVKDPVFLGGPMHYTSIFALVRAEASPHANALELAPGVWLVIEGAGVDAVMEKDPNAARYFGGYVGWKPGELADEIRQGMFIVRPADPAKMFRPDTSTLHEELLQKGLVES